MKKFYSQCKRTETQVQAELDALPVRIARWRAEELAARRRQAAERQWASRFQRLAAEKGWTLKVPPSLLPRA